MANEQIVYNVGVRFEPIQSSVTELKRILENLQPDSRGYKDLSKIINQMTAEMEKFQRTSNGGFTNTKQVDSATKSIDKMEDRLLAAQQVIERLKISDIKLSPEQIVSFDNIQQKIDEVNQKFADAKEQFKQGLLSEGNTKDFLSGGFMSMANEVNKSLDVLSNKLNSKIEQIYQRLEIARQKMNAAVTTAQPVQSIMSGLKNNPLEALSQTDTFSQFFQQLKNGGARFSTSFKGDTPVKEAFLKQLQDTFSLKDDQIKELVGKTYSQINEALRDGNYTQAFSKIFDPQDLTGQASQLTDKYNELNAIYTQAIEIKQKIDEAYASGDIAQADKLRAEGASLLTQELQKLNTEVVKGATENQKYTASLSNSQSQLDSFRSELANVTAEILRVQNAQRTFNSIKMAITNFMGFTQVLNLARNAIRAASEHIKTLDATMNSIAVVTDMTTADLWKQVDTYSQIAQSYGVTIEGAYEVSKIYYMQGRVKYLTFS